MTMFERMHMPDEAMNHPQRPQNVPDYFRGTVAEPHLHYQAAVEMAAEAAMAFARYLANIHGAADTGTMSVFWGDAKKRYEQMSEEEL